MYSRLNLVAAEVFSYEVPAREMPTYKVLAYEMPGCNIPAYKVEVPTYKGRSTRLFEVTGGHVNDEPLKELEDIMWMPEFDWATSATRLGLNRTQDSFYSYRYCPIKKYKITRYP